MTLRQYIEIISNHFKKGIKTPISAEVESELIINKKLLYQISEKLKINFIKDEGKGMAGEVCFANSPEVRPEFRLTFTIKDFLDYVYAVIYSNQQKRDFEKYLKTEFDKIPIKADTTIFWNLVALGNRLIKIHRMEDPRFSHEEALIRSGEIINKIDEVLIGDR